VKEPSAAKAAWRFLQRTIVFAGLATRPQSCGLSSQAGWVGGLMETASNESLVACTSEPKANSATYKIEEITFDANLPVTLSAKASLK
jgi:hypothetical protein